MTCVKSRLRARRSLCALLLLVLAGALSGCTAAGSRVLYVQVVNASGETIDVAASVTSPVSEIRRLGASFPAGSHVSWRVDAIGAGDAAWHVDTEAYSSSHSVLMGGSGTSGVGWAIAADGICPGNAVWLRFTANDAHTSTLAALDAPYAMLDGGRLSCDGMNWMSGPIPGADAR